MWMSVNFCIKATLQQGLTWCLHAFLFKCNCMLTQKKCAGSVCFSFSYFLPLLLLHCLSLYFICSMLCLSYIQEVNKKETWCCELQRCRKYLHCHPAVGGGITEQILQEDVIYEENESGGVMKLQKLEMVLMLPHHN